MYRWKTPPCSPRDVWSGTLHHRPENSPNTKVRQMLCDGKREPQRTERPWRPHQQLQTDICLFYSPSVVTRPVSLSFPLFSADTNESDTFFIQSTCVFFKLLGKETQIKWRVLHSWIFRSISAHGTSPWRICRHQSWRLRNAPKYTFDQTLPSEHNTQDRLEFCYQRNILVR